MIIDHNIENIDGLEVVMIYGSVARNDADNNSDLDVFALVDDALTEVKKEEVIERLCSTLNGEEINVSLYTKGVFDKMLKEGSLFLWHLKLEGIYIYNKQNKDIFLKLSRFKDYHKNLNLYKNLFNRCQESLNENNINSYDLSMLFFLCRNLSILTCFFVDEPDFGRYTSYNTLIKHLKYETLSYRDYVYLSKWRMDYTRGIEEELEYPNKEKLGEMIGNIKKLFTICERIISKEESYGHD